MTVESRVKEVLTIPLCARGLLFDRKEFVLGKEDMFEIDNILKTVFRAWLILKGLGVLWGTVK